MAGYREICEVVEKLTRLTQAMRGRQGSYRRWANNTYKRLGRLDRRACETRRRQSKVWILLQEARAAKRRGAIFIDRDELYRLASKLGKINIEHGRKLNKARWGKK